MARGGEYRADASGAARDVDGIAGGDGIDEVAERRLLHDEERVIEDVVGRRPVGVRRGVIELIELDGLGHRWFIAMLEETGELCEATVGLIGVTERPPSEQRETVEADDQAFESRVASDHRRA